MGTVPRRFSQLIVLGLAACGGPERAVGDVAPVRDEAALRRAVLGAHNRARRDAGVPPLHWDVPLAASAQAYGDEMARTGVFAHAEQGPGTGRQGENLWTGTRGSYRYGEMVGLWTAERRFFVNGVTPRFSRTGRWQDVGHYSQMVWRTTTRMGCALAANPRADYLVCRYRPAGNVLGRRAL